MIAAIVNRGKAGGPRTSWPRRQAVAAGQAESPESSCRCVVRPVPRLGVVSWPPERPVHGGQFHQVRQVQCPPIGCLLDLRSTTEAIGHDEAEPLRLI
jgi:hypothetical protein